MELWYCYGMIKHIYSADYSVISTTEYSSIFLIAQALNSHIYTTFSAVSRNVFRSTTRAVESST